MSKTTSIRALVAVGLFAAVPAGCGSGGDCPDLLNLDGQEFTELRDVPVAPSDAPSRSQLTADPATLTDLLMVVQRNSNCEAGEELRDGEATTLPVDTKVFAIDGRTDDAIAARTESEVIVFVPL